MIACRKLVVPEERQGFIEVRQLSAHNKEIFLTVSPLNFAALLLYLKNGFIISDYRRDVYGLGVDRVYMTTK
ncbi:MAG TPA: hypothetical protein VN207_06895 [Ktedonobacteraceae bacterium]|nr:hypothetical protein [Ktedonobacteraceae bacterium]